jgi:hypothetical protein
MPLSSLTSPEPTAATTPFDALALPGLGRFLRWRHARMALQIPLCLVAILMIVDGLAGPQLSPKNLATVLTWVYSRGLVALALLVAGSLFCLACPFMLPRQLARRLVHPGWRWPRRLRNKWVAAAILVLFLFIYEMFDLWATPWWTAWMIIVYFAGAVAIDSCFQGAPFCKYLCPLGQFNFVAALVSPLEVKARDLATCAACRSKDCIVGDGGCELGLFQARKVGNMDCTFCLDCVHACPHDNVGILARLPASELWDNAWRSGVGRLAQRRDIAALVTLFTFGALVNAFGMVSPVYTVEAWLANILGTPAEAPILGVIFVGGVVIAPAALLGVAAWLARRWAGLPGSILATASRYAYTLAPLGFGVWLGHASFHFFSGFWTIIPVVQSALIDLGWGFLGKPHWEWGALVPMAWLFPLEVGFLGLGFLGSLLVAYRLAAEDAPGRPWRAFLPWAGLLLLLLLAAVWLMAQPMEMRAMFAAG